VEPEVASIVRQLPLRAAVAVAARCAAIALERLRPGAGRKDRRLLEEGVETCVRVASRNDHGEEGELHGVGGKAVDLSQRRSLAPDDARLLDAVAGACYSAASCSEWLASAGPRRDVLAEFVADNVLRACRGVLGHDAKLDDEVLDLCRRVDRDAKAKQWHDESPVLLGSPSASD
jgi:hypothetical protein